MTDKATDGPFYSPSADRAFDGARPLEIHARPACRPNRAWFSRYRRRYPHGTVPRRRLVRERDAAPLYPISRPAVRRRPALGDPDASGVTNAPRLLWTAPNTRDTPPSGTTTARPPRTFTPLGSRAPVRDAGEICEPVSAIVSKTAARHSRRRGRDERSRDKRL